jgi:hypothetical protein
LVSLELWLRTAFDRGGFAVALAAAGETANAEALGGAGRR